MCQHETLCAANIDNIDNTAAGAAAAAAAAAAAIAIAITITAAATSTSTTHHASPLLPPPPPQPDPPLTMMWAWLVFDERLTPLDLFGGMVTLACIYYGSEPAKKGAPQDGATEQDGKGLKKQLGAINDDEDA